MKRLLCLLGAGTTTVVLAAFLIVMCLARDPFEAAFYKIQEGMTESEVDAIFEGVAQKQHWEFDELNKKLRILYFTPTLDPAACIDLVEGRVARRSYERSSSTLWPRLLTWVGIKREVPTEILEY